MSNTIAHTITLQDGSRCNLNMRLLKGAKPLLAFLSEIPDPRKKQGRRHSLVLILLLVFVATLQGSKGLKDASLFGKINRKLFEKLLGAEFHHGIPEANTISRVLQDIDSDLLINAFLEFLELMGITTTIGDVLSFDGKTIRGACGEEVIRHILSLFSHGSHLAVGQVGVTGKESEIAALERLLEQAAGSGNRANLIAGKLLLGDALHTQKKTVRLILEADADYLFVVKGNQPGLQATIFREMETVPASATGSFKMTTTDRKRAITTTVTILGTADVSSEGRVLLASWQGVKTIGILHRTGTRTSKDGKITATDETIGFISSRVLTAEEIATHLHHHWCIENNLHWVKDEVFGEDKHTLRKGAAPQMMSFIRSMCITMCNAMKLKSISDVIHNLQKSTRLLEQFLRMGAIV
jgi:predicted transposase YbfD/YdcC